MKRIEAVNDFVVKFANVNGSGSASANELFAKAILRMGVPVSPRNIFPSNIQGLPTWYEVRVNAKGWLGRRGGVDMMVAMNPQTWDADVAELAPGGYLFYDSTRPLPASAFRSDISVIGMPVTAICNATYDDPRSARCSRTSSTWALSALMEIDRRHREAVREQYKGKESCSTQRARAARRAGFARDHLKPPIGLRVRAPTRWATDLHGRQRARRWAASTAGATVCAWYPITPSSSVAEASRSTAASTASTPRASKRTPSCRPRTRSPRSASSRRRLERRARLHALRAPASA
jgi:2-oxoglutarate ferredoxin oxidoreductase subunit alpha